jgi:hypothetical protein
MYFLLHESVGTNGRATGGVSVSLPSGMLAGRMMYTVQDMGNRL